MDSMASSHGSLDEFLRPLRVDNDIIRTLSREFVQNFRQLSAESLDQFLPTPISESILRPITGSDRGRYVPSRA